MKRSQKLTYLSGALLLLWTVTVIVLIAREPDPGEPDPQALGEAFSHAVQTQDIAAARRLLGSDPGDERIEDLLAQARCGEGVEVSAEFLILACGRIPITELDGRWFLDPWADPLGKRG